MCINNIDKDSKNDYNKLIKTCKTSYQLFFTMERDNQLW